MLGQALPSDLWPLFILGVNMIRKRIWQLLLSFVMTAVLGTALYSKSMGRYPDVNKESLICILIALAILFIVPGLLVVTKSKEHFSTSVATMLFSVFQITFWTNLIMIIIPVPNNWVRIFINTGIVAICIFFAAIIIRYELRPKAGKPNKTEMDNIKKALLELEIASSIMPEINGEEMAEIKENMNSFINASSSIVHGIDSNILNECRSIRNSALCKDADSVEFHTSFLGQLLVLAKQKI